MYKRQVPNKDVASAEQAKRMRDFAKKYDIENYFEVGRGGVCHQLMIEKGFVAPGRLIVGADSHTCLLYTSDAADDLLCVDLGGRRTIKKKPKSTTC